MQQHGAAVSSSQSGPKKSALLMSAVQRAFQAQIGSASNQTQLTIAYSTDVYRG